MVIRPQHFQGITLSGLLLGDDGTNKEATSTGKLNQENEHIYNLWCSGRVCCEGMLIQLRVSRNFWCNVYVYLLFFPAGFKNPLSLVSSRRSKSHLLLLTGKCQVYLTYLIPSPGSLLCCKWRLRLFSLSFFSSSSRDRTYWTSWPVWWGQQVIKWYVFFLLFFSVQIEFWIS